MIKKFIVLLFLMICTCGFSQTTHYNTKNGYAVQGYDVVSYFDKTPWEGKKEFSTTFDGVKFKFHNAKNLKRFEESPLKYLPKYGGYCAYAIAMHGKKVKVDPETYEIRDNKLYLFYNKGKNNTLEFWLNESPEVLRQKADKNWEEIKN